MTHSQPCKNELLEAAFLYQEMGFSVIPVGKNKKPLIPWKKYQGEKAGKEQIEAWFKDFNVLGIGIVTGAISGIVVVDIEKGGKYNDLPPSICSQTGGGGIHIFYQYDPKHPISNFTRIRQLTDIRGDGGYVIVPPSGHPSGGSYSWLKEPGENEMQTFPYFLLEAKKDEDEGISKNWTEFSKDKVSMGQRNDQAAKVIGKLLHKIDPELWDSLGWPEIQKWNQENCEIPLKENELKKVWESIKKAQRGSVKKKKDKNKEKDAIEIYSKTFKGGAMVETYYDQDLEKTGFLVYENGKVIKKPCIVMNGETYKPPPPTNSLVSGRFVKLPSNITSFGTEQELFNEIRRFIHEYVEVSDEFEEIASFYVLFSWVYDAFHELPYLRVLGDYGTGKSRMIKVIGALGYKSIFLNGATSVSAIFRMISEVNGMIALDEGDFRYSDTNHELVKILNSGFQKGIPVFRSEAKPSGSKKSFDPTPFDVFCPKVLATRRNFQDEALESRCLTYAMQTSKREDIPENLDDEFERKALLIRNKLISFRFKRLSEGIKKRSLPKISIEPRLRQIITPLYSIVQEPEAKERLLTFIHKKQGDVYESRFNSQEGQLLQAILMVLKKEREPTMKEITQKYNDEFAGSFPIKARKTGEIVGQILNLEKNNGSKGIYLVASEANEKRINELKFKFGLNQTSMDIVNNVNIELEAINQMTRDAEEVFDTTPKPRDEELPFT